MMKAIRIIERLMTQNKYHSQQVLYKNYPPVDIVRAEAEDEDDNKDGGGMMIFGNEKKEEKKVEEEKEVKEDEDAITLTHLFKFECDITKERQISCIDINVVNPDLIAVGYGEFDVDATKIKPYPAN